MTFLLLLRHLTPILILFGSTSSLPHTARIDSIFHGEQVDDFVAGLGNGGLEEVSAKGGPLSLAAWFDTVPSPDCQVPPVKITEKPDLGGVVFANS